MGYRYGLIAISLAYRTSEFNGFVVGIFLKPNCIDVYGVTIM